jgi:hypothetical protein
LLGRANILARVELDSLDRPKTKGIALDAGSLAFCAVFALI